MESSFDDFHDEYVLGGNTLFHSQQETSTWFASPSEQQEQQEQEQQHYYFHQPWREAQQQNNRFLAGGGYDSGPVRIDYSVMSVGVMTLGLILIVEVVRHKLDHAAHGRPFFHAVLEGCYTELATLGIVEFFLHLLAEYYEEYDKAKKQVFADVHFLLFYTAILNAFQSILLAFVATRVSQKMWVETEMLELNHYVEIREEFEHVKQQLENLKHVRRQKEQKEQQQQEQEEQRQSKVDAATAAAAAAATTNGDNHHHNNNHNNNRKQEQQQQQEHKKQQPSPSVYVEEVFTFNRQGVFHAWQGLVDRIRYPRLKRKYNELLVQVRFHELRISFLQAYKMPLKLKVSDYLVKRQLKILMQLVHVSSVAWLLLTGAVNVLYFALGVITYYKENPELVGVLLIGLYYCIILLFIVLVSLTYNKMKAIFSSMMHDKDLWDVGEYVEEEETKRLHKKQRKLFWGSNPNYVISLIQFMQFGYAVALSALIIFWEEINDGSIAMYAYVIAIFSCYGVFVYMTGQVIPRYTLVTSIGQLVDFDLLRETMATFHLEEAKRKQLEQLEMLAYEESIHDYYVHEASTEHTNNGSDHTAPYAMPILETPAPTTSLLLLSSSSSGNTAAAAHQRLLKGPAATLETITDVSDRQTDHESNEFFKPLKQQQQQWHPHTINPNTNNVTTTVDPVRLNTNLQSFDSVDHLLAAHQKSDNATTAVDPVRLKANLENFDSVDHLLAAANIPSSPEEKRRMRRNRRKAVSDGVSAMAAMNALAPLHEDLPQSSADFQSAMQKHPIHSYDDFNLTKTTDTRPVWKKDLSQICEKGESTLHLNASGSGEMLGQSNEEQEMPNFQTQTERQPPRRRRRAQKSISDGVALMSKMHADAELERTSAPLRAGGRRMSSSIAKPKYSSASKATAVDSADLLAELVKLDTSQLRTNLPEIEQKRLDKRQEEKQQGRRRRRGKTVSEGVAAMAAVGTTLSAAAEDLLGFHLHTVKKTDSKESDKSQQMSAELGGSFQNLRASDDSEMPSRRKKRVSRVRSSSDGVAFMSRLASADLGDKFRKDSSKAQGADGRKLGDGPPLDSIIVHSAELEHSKEVTKEKGNEEETEKYPNPNANHVAATAAGKMETENNSTSSDGYYSDADDVPDIENTTITKFVSPRKPELTVRERLRGYFLSKKYVVMSNVFGTMIAFFLVGERIESFLRSSGIVSDDFVSFNFRRDIIFWLLSTWLFFFIVDSFILYRVFAPYRGLSTFREKKVFVSCILDAIISITCVTVLYVAESKRCCNSTSGEERRYLAEKVTDEKTDSNYGDYPSTTYGDYPSATYDDLSTVCSCPAFGSRTYGGLGSLEPYTSLVGLRVLRHYAAKHIVLLLDSNNAPKKENNEEKSMHSLKSNPDPFDVFSEKSGTHQNESHGHHKEMTGTAAQLWEAAIVKHPEIAERYGEFSGEILRAMLGVSLIDSGKVDERQKEDVTLTHDIDASLSNELQPTKVPDSEEHNAVMQRASKTFSLNKRFAGLSAEAQEVILAGRLGRNVKNSSQLNLEGLADTQKTVAALHETEALNNLEAGREVVFQVDLAAKEVESTFIYPNARLVRNMRRCDRKLLPILDKWSVVDVVMTRFEIVYFDAIDVKENQLDASAEGTRQALVATKGGKHLRLCDVALGRRVVGHLQLTDIQSVHVDRMMPGTVVVGDEDGPDVETTQSEYWKPATAKSESSLIKRGEEWAGIKQDILRIQTVLGRTVCLRFYSDLEESVGNPKRLAGEDEILGDIFKNNALLWAQTIGRFCGPDQLKQNLMHFGLENSDELRDYLVLHENIDAAKGLRRVPSESRLRRHNRMASLDLSLAAQPGRGSHRRVQTLGGGQVPSSPNVMTEHTEDHATKEKTGEKSEKVVSFLEPGETNSNT